MPNSASPSTAYLGVLGGGILPARSRSQLVGGRLLKGDFSSALEALMDPRALPPDKQTEAVDVVFPDSEKEGGLTEALQRIITDPITWIGVIGTIAFPTAGSKAAEKFLKVHRDYTKRITLLDKIFSGADDMLLTPKGNPTPLLKLMTEASTETAVEMDKLTGLFRKAVDNFQKVEGRAIGERDWFTVMAKAERWDDPANELWQQIGNLTGRKVRVKPITLSDGQEGLLQAWKDTRHYYMEELFGVLGKAEKADLRKMLQARGASPFLPTKSGESFYAPRYQHTSGKDAREKIVNLLRAGDPDSVGEAIDLMSPFGNRAISERQWRAIAQGEAIPGSLKARQNLYVPSLEQAKEIRDVIGEEAVGALESVFARPSYRVGSKALIPTGYNLNLGEVADKYIASMAKAKTWSVGGYNKRIKPELEAVERQNPELYDRVTQVDLPAMKGGMTRWQYERARGFAGMKASTIKWLQTGVLQSSKAGRQIADELTGWILKSPTLRSRDALSSSIAGHIYTSVLGGDPSQVVNNSLQTISTTLPYIGAKATLAGIRDSVKRTENWIRLRFGKGLSAEDAFRQAFPEMLESGLEASSSMAREIFEQLEKAKLGIEKQGIAAKGFDAIRHAMLAGFRGAERANWTVAFYGGLDLAKRKRLPMEASISFARAVVEKTQFLGAEFLRPNLTAKAGPLMRQFTQYPLKLTGLYLNSLRQGGLGTIARTALAANVAYEGGRAAGLDLSRGLAWGGLPVPTEGRPGSPLPLIPPALSIPMSLYQDWQQGELNAVKRVWPLAFPGGLAITRMASTFSPTFAKTTNRIHADYANRQPDGRYPMYTGDGRLIGLYSAAQVYAVGMGLTPAQISDEREVLKYMMKQRDQMVALKQAMLEKYTANDMAGYQSAVATWKATYPGLQLPVHSEDFKRIHDRRTMTRIERFANSLPAEARPMFKDVYGWAATQRVSSYTPPPPMGF